MQPQELLETNKSVEDELGIEDVQRTLDSKKSIDIMECADDGAGLYRGRVSVCVMAMGEGPAQAMKRCAGGKAGCTST